jgi:ornithine racemase
MRQILPRIEISLSKIRENSQLLSTLYGVGGISLMGVSKAVLGDPAIARAMIQGGVSFMADSRLENIQRMRRSGVLAQFVLLRTALSQAELIVQWVDISLNSELETLKALSYYAKLKQQVHQVIIMVELGDLREGVCPCDLSSFFSEALTLSYLEIIGIGCNLACYGGVKPDDHNMHELSIQVDRLEKEFCLDLKIISGGNSANYDWYNTKSVTDCTADRINNLRLGESILLGRETVHHTSIPGLHTRAFQLFAEVIESKQKPSIPLGEICEDAFGKRPSFVDRGRHQRSIVALGRQDVLVSGLSSRQAVTILGASSDHLILDSGDRALQIGEEVQFDLDYGALLAAMTSPFVQKKFVP